MNLALLTLLACTVTPPKDAPVEDTAAGAVNDADGDGYGIAEGDCDDGDASVRPGADESCNGQDDDCDGEADEGISSPVWTDADGDGYGDPGLPSSGCAMGDTGLSEGLAYQAGDCDDADAAVHPDAQEACDGRDEDCDGEVDDGAGTTFYADADGDGFGDPDSSTQACASPVGFVEDATDCDDVNALAWPGALEVCDEVDNDCDGEVDEGVTTSWAIDLDGDGHGDPAITQEACVLPTGYAAVADDCDDADAGVNPDSVETCGGGDEDCDGVTDEDDALDATAWHTDADGDGHGAAALAAVACVAPAGTVADGDDCDDGDASQNPSTVWYIDVDGDGAGSRAYTLTQCAAPRGYVRAAGDCDDARAAVLPGATEVCNGLDDDCDGATDDADTRVTGTSPWFADLDGDGFGDPDASAMTCVAPAGHVADATDCDDARVATNPRSVETCNGIDDDCDGSTDEAGATGEVTVYVDADGDGRGERSRPLVQCGVTAGTSATGDDCDDADAGVTDCGSCADVLAAGLSTGDGVYALDPCGSGVAQDYYCDQTNDGGGWTLAGWQAANARTSMGVANRRTPGSAADWSSDLACLVFDEVAVFNRTTGEFYTEGYGARTWSFTGTNLTLGTNGNAFKHGTYGPSSSLIMMGCVGYGYSGGLNNTYACDNDDGPSVRGHLADYAGERCAGGRLDGTWAWGTGSSCLYRGTPYTWGYAVR